MEEEVKTITREKNTTAMDFLKGLKTCSADLDIVLSV